MPLLNRALRGEYPPGSTVKPAIALAGLVTRRHDAARTRRSARAFFMLPGIEPSLPRLAPGRHGAVAMETAIAQSCDVYFYELASMMGVDNLSEFARAFRPRQPHRHRHRRRDAGHPADARMEESARLQESRRPGVVPRRDGELRHRPGLSHRHAAAGRAHDVDPRDARQELIKPRLVTAYREQGTGKSKPSRRKLNRRRSRPSARALARSSRTAWSRYDTAPARLAQPGGRGIPDRRQDRHRAGVHRRARTRTTKPWRRVNERLLDHWWFIAFAPADAPKIAVAVIIENGKHGTAAAPIARRVLDQFLLGKTTTPDIPPPVIKRRRASSSLPDAPGDE